MAILWLVFALGLICITLFSKCRVFIRLRADKDGFFASVTLYLLDEAIRLHYFVEYCLSRRTKLTYKLPFELKKIGKTGWQRLSARQKAVIGKFLRRVALEWSLSARIGTGDAAQTALLTGAASSIVKALACALMRIMPKQTQKISIAPDFAGARAQARMRCMITIRVGHIMLMAIRIAFIKLTEAINAWSILRRLCAQPWKT